jgi:uncharacterized membrane protein
MISFNKYPIDIILCMLWSLILIPITIFDVNETLCFILGLPFILFIPGYILIFALFPTRKTNRGIDFLERITLSFGFSIAIIPLIGLGLNYTSWGIRLESILLCIFVFIACVGFLGIYRWFNIDSDERFRIRIDLSQVKSASRLNSIFTITIIISILLAVIAVVYISINVTQEEKYTEFYILPIDRNTTHYLKNLSIGERYNLILGIFNHEYKTINYVIEIWLINQSTYYNELEKENKTVINNMWFIDKISITLDHKNFEKTLNTQWEHRYSISINRIGSFKLAFLLFTSPSGIYNKDIDYAEIAEEKINNAYREIHLWINVN